MNRNIFVSILVIIGILGWFIFRSTQPKPELANLDQISDNATTDLQESQKKPDNIEAPEEFLELLEQEPDNTMQLEKPEMTIDTSQEYFATLETNQGSMKVKLFADKTPITVNNFVYLANKDFYDNVIFHRVIEGFMIQGGDPTGTGRGGPGYQFEDEIVDSLSFTKAGQLAMANSGPGTNGSQFFITLDATSWLDGNHTIFGEVVEGMDVVEKIGRTQTGAGDRPIEDITIENIAISN